MKNQEKIEIYKLPDIEMYGGDTSVWEVSLINDRGAIITVNSDLDCVATLSFMPFKITSGIGGNALLTEPILKKSGVLKPSLNGGTAAVFQFEESDTKYLRGKFTYQIEIQIENNIRIRQGHVYIKQNINNTKS